MAGFNLWRFDNALLLVLVPLLLLVPYIAPYFAFALWTLISAIAPGTAFWDGLLVILINYHCLGRVGRQGIVPGTEKFNIAHCTVGQTYAPWYSQRFSIPPAPWFRLMHPGTLRDSAFHLGQSLKLMHSGILSDSTLHPLFSRLSMRSAYSLLAPSFHLC